ncbi:MAG: hypothetical protein ABIO44_02395 [Saprospiraceae bacterium]
MMNRRFYILLTLLSLNFLSAQEKPTYNKNGIFVDLNLGIGKASGLLSNRFGSHNLIGGGVSYHPASGLDYGVKFHYFFGNSVKEDVLAPYRTDFGQLIGGDGFLTDVTLKER